MANAIVPCFGQWLPNVEPCGYVRKLDASKKSILHANVAIELVQRLH